MMQQKFRRQTALLLSALSLLLGACAPSDAGSDASPPAQSSPAQDSTVPVSDSPDPTPSDSPDPTPPESGSSQPAPSAPSSQSQSASPSPTPSGAPAPSAPSQPPVSTAAPVPFGPVGSGPSVDNEWFSDAVFLGDSRTDGLRLYSGIRGASFICHTGLSVFTVGTNQCIDLEGEKVTAMGALENQQWGKVYVMLGINELGYATSSFKSTYADVVDQIKQLQPNAAIYLQTLIPVNESIAYQHGTNTAINNEKLKEFNQAIAEVAQAAEVFLVDVDTPFWSADGCLDAENTSDGVHLTRAGYVAWLDYLKTHTADTAADDYFLPAEGGEKTP